MTDQQDAARSAFDEHLKSRHGTAQARSDGYNWGYGDTFEKALYDAVAHSPAQGPSGFTWWIVTIAGRGGGYNPGYSEVAIQIYSEHR
jgi:hypothetical protein